MSRPNWFRWPPLVALIALLAVPLAEPLRAQNPIPPTFDTLTVPGLVVLHAPSGLLRAQRLAELLNPPPPLPALPVGTPDSVELWLPPDEATFAQITGGAPPEWGAAVAIPARRVIVLPGFSTRRLPPDQLQRVLLHEWAHLGLHSFLGDVRVPRWFSEGYAEWASGGWNFEEGWRLRVAIALNRAPPLDSLALDWPRNRATAEVAYLLSGSAVAYLARSGGPEGMALFLERWRDGGRFEDALRQTYGVTTGQFEEDWVKHVKREYGWLFVITRSVLFWGILATVLGGMLLIRRGRNRERLARLRASEPPNNPDYWMARERKSAPLWDQSASHTTYGPGIRIEWSRARKWEPRPPEPGPRDRGSPDDTDPNPTEE